MTDQDRQALIDEANALALDFPPNIPTKKLQAMVDETKGPAVKEDEPDETVDETIVDESVTTDPDPAPAPAEKVSADTTAISKSLKERAKTDKRLAKRLRIKEAKEKAFKTRIVTITNKDKRENEVMTTAFLSVENEYFGKSRVVPLDIPVELEVCLIKIAESTMMTLHKDEIKNGQRTGNKVAVPTKKYIVSYSDLQPE
jgi:hypothetical protein